MGHQQTRRPPQPLQRVRLAAPGSRTLPITTTCHPRHVTLLTLAEYLLSRARAVSPPGRRDARYQRDQAGIPPIARDGAVFESAVNLPAFRIPKERTRRC